ncbi:hypothetical protein GGQ91_000883 [Methylobacterium fujisawaense]|uniref:Uncharacterized protein n=1 Tax=Methylobacterium fujisawaense TaxID=107400 RepID=A0ABR6D627_9HYPH|nr:hypothetical protein [Methylobacterium fujisawaense]MBA9061522.1 hypothetical protein [Methylobacterium fujisawaense]
MDPERLQAGLARFAADLTLAGEPIAFDVVVARHIDFLIEVRATGLRWPAIARMLAAAGAHRSGGAAFSADQIRASTSRVRRRRTSVAAYRVPEPPRSDHRLLAPPEPVHRTSERTPGPDPSPLRMTRARDLAGPDLSDAEILAARRRLLGF